MTDMNPEDKKMMDSMGVKMPGLKNIQKNMSGITNAKIKKVVADENRIVPQKDAARINAALAVTISNAEVGSYINKTHHAVVSKLPATDKIKNRRNISANFNTEIFCCKYGCGFMDGWQTNTSAISYGRGLQS